MNLRDEQSDHTTEEKMSERACEQCPWRTSNQGKRTAWGFYTKENLRRLWRGLCGRRQQLQPQSCHLTDPSHEDHVKAGASEKATAKECPGSVIVMIRENNILGKYLEDAGGPDGFRLYSRERFGLNREAACWWTTRGIPLVGGPALPDVNDDSEIGVPDWLTARS